MWMTMLLRYYGSSLRLFIDMAIVFEKFYAIFSIEYELSYPFEQSLNSLRDRT